MRLLATIEALRPATILWHLRNAEEDRQRNAVIILIVGSTTSVQEL